MMVKVQEGSNGQILMTIPRELAKALGLKKGVEVDFSVLDSESLRLEKST